MKTFLKKIILRLLAFEAKRVIQRYKPHIVGVVGSVGKTSTKDAIATVLSSKYKTGKSKKSYNSEFGTPLTILGLSSGGNNIFSWMHILFEGFLLSVFHHDYPEWLVLEVGADRPGEIKRMSEWLKTDILVATAYGEVPVHIEFFDSKEKLVEEDMSMLKTLKKDGLLIVNGDDEQSLAFKDNWEGESQLVAVSNKEADFTASGYKILSGEHKFPEGFSINIETKGKLETVLLHGVLGEQHAYSLLSATAVGIHTGITFKKIAGALEAHRTPNGRMRLIPGIKETLIIDDTYNAASTAVGAALLALRNVSPTGRKIAVLGDMMELGEYSLEEHKRIGRLAASVCDVLYTTGIRAMVIANEALEAGMKGDSVTHFEDSYKAGNELERLIKKGDVILVKGSQSMRMERVVLEIMAEPEKKEELLVRQDSEWAGK